MLTTFIDRLHGMDQRWTLEINSWSGDFSDPVFQFLSMKLVWIPLYLFIAWLLWYRLGWKKTLIVLLGIGLTFLVIDSLTQVVQEAVARIRPCHDEWMRANGLDVLEKGGGHFGFYSAHAANTLGFAICASLGVSADRAHRNRWFAPSLILWAVLVGVSRIFVGKHYFGDVLAGLVVGALFGLAFGLLVRFIILRFMSGTRAANS